MYGEHQAVRSALVTGGAGFIGSHLCEQLLDRGVTVTCLDNFSTGAKVNVQHIASHLRVIEGDINHQAVAARLAAEHFDIVFHYAATVGVRRTVEHPQLVYEDKRGIDHIAELARRGVVGRVVFASSSEVYGPSAAIPMAEDQPTVAWNPYTEVKLYGEDVFRRLWVESHIPTVSLRFFNVYGPRQAGNSYGFVTATFIQQALQGQSPTVFGDGKQTRDFVYVGDNVRLSVLAATNSNLHGQVLNVGTGHDVSITQLADAIIGIVGCSGHLRPIFLPPRAGEVQRRQASTKKLVSILGTRCQTTLGEGLWSTITWYRLIEKQEQTTPLTQPAVQAVS